MKLIILFLLVMLSTGCASLPEGPSVMVLPGTGLSFEQFRNDDSVCRQYAAWQVGGATANQAAVSSGAATAAAGTALGAAAGAAIAGGTGAAVGSGAAIGAGTGLVGGGLVGTGMAQSSGDATQQRYDIAYIQCMYAKGHRVPVSGRFSDERPQKAATPPANIPPPPPGTPPPPPSK
ncbi:MAG: hypothetical protein ACXV7F_03785 [Methylomonas sp.]